MNTKPLITAGILLGVGLGGFFDGIVFHQILQLHSMLSNRIIPDTVANYEINMFWDGIFHAFTWIMTVFGLILLWKAVARKDVPLSGRILVGSMILGWGLFNAIEGIIDHQILQIHHVVQRAAPTEQFYYDMIFLAVGIIQIILGLYFIKKERRLVR